MMASKTQWVTQKKVSINLKMDLLIIWCGQKWLNMTNGGHKINKSDNWSIAILNKEEEVAETKYVTEEENTG